MADLTLPTNFRPTLPPRTKSQALKEGLLNAPFYAATWPLIVTDIVESGLDALRGTSSPNRTIQAASALKQLFGGDPIPQEYERGVEDWDTAKYDVAGSLPAFSVNPLRAIRDIPKALKHGAQSFALAQSPAHVVKPKSSNWRIGSVEDALRGLKKYPNGWREQSMADRVAQTNQHGVLGAPYKHRTGMTGEVGAVHITPEQGLINQWIEGPLTKYVKTRMASPEDEVRKLAEQGILHYEPTGGFVWGLYGRRAKAGFPEAGMAKSELAGMWEDAADNAIIPGTFRYMDKSPIDFNAPDAAAKQAEALRKIGGDFAAQNPDAVAYEANIQNGVFSRDAGFSHLIDELSNALNPNSGLPHHLQLSPEAMQNLSMEKAVRRVADINAWREAQKVEANRKLAEQASLVREYAENNPKGLRWVELRKGEVPTEGDIDALYTADEAAKKALADQLKYEGDVMQNCVSGYCDDVLSGRKRIFSLRDAKGEPHVTVEVGPAKVTADINTFKNVRDMTQEEFEAAAARINSPVRTNKALAESSGWLYRDDAPYWVTEKEFAPNIKQIKYKQNSTTPVPAYLPFVQDFVRNSPHGQPWSEVRDLESTGLRRARDIWNDLELAKIKEAGHTVGDFVTPDEKERVGRAVWGDAWGNYASGGRVRTPAPQPGSPPPTLGIRGHSEEIEARWPF